MKTRITLMFLALALPAVASAKLNVVASLPTYGAIARAIGGDRLKVTSLARGTEDPHFVDPRPSFIRVLNRADLLISGGAGLEQGWLPPLVQSARNARINPGASGRLFLLTGVRMLGVPQGPISRAQGDVHAQGNPHFELDPENGRLIARRIAATLAQLDPEGEEQYQAGLRSFEKALDERMKGWRELAAPLRGVKVLSYHQTYEYLAARFGFEIAGYLEPKPGIVPSPSHVSRLIPRMKTAGVRMLIMEPNRSRRLASYAAEHLKIPLVILPLMVGGVKEAEDYFSLIDYNLKAMVGALK